MSEQHPHDREQTANPNKKSLKRKVVEATAGTLAVTAVVGAGAGLKSWQEGRAAAYEAEARAEKEERTAALAAETQESVRVVAEAIARINPKEGKNEIYWNGSGDQVATMLAKQSNGDDMVDLIASLNFSAGTLDTYITKTVAFSDDTSWQEQLSSQFAVSPGKLAEAKKDGVLTKAELKGMLESDTHPTRVIYSSTEIGRDGGEDKESWVMRQLSTGKLVDSREAAMNQDWDDTATLHNLTLRWGDVHDLNKAVIEATEA